MTHLLQNNWKYTGLLKYTMESILSKLSKNARTSNMLRGNIHYKKQKIAAPLSFDTHWSTSQIIPQEITKTIP